MIYLSLLTSISLNPVYKLTRALLTSLLLRSAGIYLRSAGIYLSNSCSHVCILTPVTQRKRLSFFLFFFGSGGCDRLVL